jgi:hypothetical protein
MADEPTPEEVERRAQELARRVMSRPYQKQEWPKQGRRRAAPKASGAASRPDRQLPREER